MKKKILLMTLGLCAFSFAQKTYVTGTLPVKVEERTLFYNGGGFEVSSADAVVTNQGNIQVRGDGFAITNNGTNTNMFMDWQSKGVDADANGINEDDGYGQLIIDQDVAVTASSKVLIEIEMPSATAIDNVQIGFPFSTADKPINIIDHSANSDINFTNNSNRLYHPLYKWNNQLMRFDRKNKNGGVNNWEYYIVRHAGGMQTYNNGAVRPHIGTPSPGTITRELYDHSSLPNLKLTSSVNAYNEVYSSYIEEYFETHQHLVDNPNEWGKNQYQYGNPYTSNLDLSYIGFEESAWYDEDGDGAQNADGSEDLDDGNFIDGLIGVYKLSGGNEVNPVYDLTPNVYTADIATADTDGKFQAGDSDVLLIKPMEAFVIKTDGTAGQEIYFNDGLKTFAYSAKVKSDAAGTGEVDFRTAPESGLSDDYYQVRLNLMENNSYINRTYVVAQENLTNGIGGILESVKDDFTKGIYTKQELQEGEGLDPSLSAKKYYINQVNFDYFGTPIPLFAEGLESGDEYTIFFDLCLGINDLPEDQFSYNDSNAKYYFHDIYTDEYFEVFNNSEYTFTKTSGDGSEEGARFELFFGGAVDNLGNDDIASAMNSTVVYQSDKENLIRFDSDWSTANISVYTAVGQIVFFKENVETSNDFLLPLHEENVTTYIVKIENPETGEIISKKVIK